MSSRVSKRITEQESGQDLFESKREKSLLKGIPRFKEVFAKYKAKTRKRTSSYWAIRTGVWTSRSRGSKSSGLSIISEQIFTKPVRLRARWITVLRSSYVHVRCTWQDTWHSDNVRPLGQFIFECLYIAVLVSF